jgi:UDP-3-O-[3-hydroxymyristoyl] glucosamine N-acyltransferase
LQAPIAAAGPPRDVVIAGAGNLGKLLLDCIDGDPRWNVVGFIDDGRAGETQLGLPIFSSDNYDVSLTANAIVAIGYPDMRRAMIERLAPLGLTWCTYLDRRSVIGRGAALGRGSIILGFATVASGVRVGEFTYISGYAHIGAGAVIGSWTSVMPGVCVATSVIGDRCILGLRSACLEGALVGDGVRVAPGVLVRTAVPANTVVVGTKVRAILQPA